MRKRMKHKPVFVMMVGLPGSGKTYYAKENLAQVTKTLIQYEEQKIQGILQFND